MSLYYVQKLLNQLNRDPRARERYEAEPESMLREEVHREAGHGGFEIRTFIAVATATEGATGELWFYAPIPIFAIGCTVATMGVE